jgi:hypothetical protein
LTLSLPCFLTPWYCICPDPGFDIDTPSYCICPDPGFGIDSEGNFDPSKAALRVASKLQGAVLQSGNLSMMTAIRKHLDDTSKAECLASVLKLLEYVEEVSARHLFLVSAVTVDESHTVQEDDEFMMKPMHYAKAMVMLARDVDAQPLGAFSFHAPSRYLPFLQQLAIDLMA